MAVGRVAGTGNIGYSTNYRGGASNLSTPVNKKQKKKRKLKEKLRAMEQLGVLVHRRGMAKGKVTKILSTIQPQHEDNLVLSQAQIKVYTKKLESAQKEYEVLQEKILELVSAEDMDAHDQHFEAFDDLCDMVGIILEEQGESGVPIAANSIPPNAATSLVIHQPLRMPIPTFDGRYESWPKFKAMFMDLLDKAPDPPAVKLYHLDKALVGSAAGLIDAKTINEGNYAHAWEILEERYENKRHAIDCYIHGLLNLTKMSKETNGELRKLIDECTRHVESVKFLEQPFTGVSEQIVVHLLAVALDKETRRRWESTVKHGELPGYDMMLKFLKEQCFVLERCESTNPKQSATQVKPINIQSKASFAKSHASTASAESEYKCDFCGKGHLNYTCPEFKALPLQQRLSKVRERNTCFNCLRKGHRSRDCPSDKTCFKCNRKHHSLLHAEAKTSSPVTKERSSSREADTQTVKKPTQEENHQEQTQLTAATCSSVLPIQHILLLTAVVEVMDKNYKPHPCRILLDSGSQANLISQSMINALGLQQFPLKVTVKGVNSTKSHSSMSSIVQIRSKYSDFRASLQCLVTDNVTADLPTSSFDVSNWVLPTGVQLADPTFHQTGKIDMLIGSQWFLKLLLPGEKTLAENLPVLKEIQFGWVLGGSYGGETTSNYIVHSHAATFDDLDHLICWFWEVEEVSNDAHGSNEEECGQHFLNTHRRDASGRYIVQLPLKDCFNELGDSRAMALRRFYALERRLNQHTDLKQQNSEFMSEYEDLGHCKEINEFNDPPHISKWYLPHHAVIRPSNTTTKCRVVFDASAKVFGRSLNDVMKIGTIIQSDLQSIILRFREPRYVLTTDIAKMYRQIVVDDCHTPLQRIFWRKDSSSVVRVLELTTVTYGTASAPFLATRALKQLSTDERDKFPMAADIVDKNFYVDNGLFGYDDLSQARDAQNQLIHLLKAGGFHLHKWSSNSLELLETIPEADREQLVSFEESGANEVIKMLGLMRNPSTDELLFVSMPTCDIETPTKRQVLSLIARMFDPLGLVSPVVIIGKLLMQQTWKENIDWDEQITGELLKNWKYFLVTNAAHFGLHGFADASQGALEACVYIRSVIPGLDAVVKLLCGKSKVVPKAALTIPRKELAAALLLHRLVRKIISSSNLLFSAIVLWSDGQVVLAWLKKNPSLLEIFVRNRVCEIISTENDFEWRYVKTSENPADVVSRGQSAIKLATNNLWWSGPLFLKSDPYELETPTQLCDDDIPEMKCVAVVHTVGRYGKLPVFQKFESFRKLQKVIAYVLRFCKNAKEKLAETRILKKYPTMTEMNESMKVIVRVIQYQEFADEIARLKSATLRRQFWVPNGRSAVRKITRSCVQCFKTKPTTVGQFMGDLPASRCERAPAFQKVGLDYAGPILLKQPGQKAVAVKGYICIFVCMVTKGIHLEAVESLSTDSFIAALHRFVSRRGVPEDMFSDNGTNFVGAKNRLHELYQMFKQQLTERKLFEFCQPRKINWKMIPPSAPHMGGIWEQV
ncbi:uncharacterized protein LOC131687629 [Topomyia yanbarensis]|uniref:uncharacterized protein LOC131687629 n=1 Tax=Topomyia yanbarensis TaxID=2498891 RepID=UPI00273CD2FB|nr:uncharacterized protein LOC131687629 [Topomyia yanbarensis]